MSSNKHMDPPKDQEKVLRHPVRRYLDEIERETDEQRSRSGRGNIPSAAGPRSQQTQTHLIAGNGRVTKSTVSSSTAGSGRNDAEKRRQARLAALASHNPQANTRPTTSATAPPSRTGQDLATAPSATNRKGQLAQAKPRSPGDASQSAQSSSQPDQEDAPLTTSANGLTRADLLATSKDITQSVSEIVIKADAKYEEQIAKLAQVQAEIQQQLSQVQQESAAKFVAFEQCSSRTENELLDHSRQLRVFHSMVQNLEERMQTGDWNITQHLERLREASQMQLLNIARLGQGQERASRQITSIQQEGATLVQRTALDSDRLDTVIDETIMDRAAIQYLIQQVAVLTAAIQETPPGSVGEPVAPWSRTPTPQPDTNITDFGMEINTEVDVGPLAPSRRAMAREQKEWMKTRQNFKDTFADGEDILRQEVGTAISSYDEGLNKEQLPHPEKYIADRKTLQDFGAGAQQYLEYVLDQANARMEGIWNECEELIQFAVQDDVVDQALLDAEIAQHKKEASMLVNDEIPRELGAIVGNFKTIYLRFFRQWPDKALNNQLQFVKQWQNAHNQLLKMLQLDLPGYAKHQCLPTTDEVYRAATSKPTRAIAAPTGE